MLTVAFQTRDIYMRPCLFEVLLSHSVSVLALMENFSTPPEYVTGCYVINIRASIRSDQVATSFKRPTLKMEGIEWKWPQVVLRKV